MKNVYERHIHELCKEHKIKLVIRKRMPVERSCAFARFVWHDFNFDPLMSKIAEAEITVPPIKNLLRYTTALHEIGHICARALNLDTEHVSQGGNPNLSSIGAEVKAWEWAFGAARWPLDMEWVSEVLKGYIDCCTDPIPPDHPVMRLV